MVVVDPGNLGAGDTPATPAFPPALAPPGVNEAKALKGVYRPFVALVVPLSF